MTLTKREAYRWLFVTGQEWDASGFSDDLDREVFFLFWHRAMRSFLGIPMRGGGHYPAWLLRETSERAAS